MSRHAFLGLCAGLLLAGPVFGHARLLSSLPAAASQLGSAPTSLTLTFNENVKLAMVKITTAGREVPVSIDRSAAASPSVTVALPSLAAGTYEVHWSALTPSDGHVVKGSYSFVLH